MVNGEFVILLKDRRLYFFGKRIYFAYKKLIEERLEKKQWHAPLLHASIVVSVNSDSPIIVKNRWGYEELSDILLRFLKGVTMFVKLTTETHAFYYPETTFKLHGSKIRQSMLDGSHFHRDRAALIINRYENTIEKNVSTIEDLIDKLVKEVEFQKQKISQ